MPNATSYDFAVIGAGPAGSSAARRLAKTGAEVALFERSRMPRRKPCGGALSERGIRYLDFSLPEPLVERHIYGARVHYGSDAVEAKLNQRVAVLVNRSEFDLLLLSEAEESGARVIWDEVVSIAQEPDHLALETRSGRTRAKCAIVCEGASRKLSRLAARGNRADEQGFCMEAEIPVPKPDKYSDLQGLIDVYFGVARCGYGWVFHHGSYYSVGVGGLCSAFGDPVSAFRGFLEEREIALGECRPAGQFIPRGGIRRALFSERLLLAGDAAGFVDPFYGEGIAYAIRSGQLAAETALTAYGANDFSRSRLSQYEAMCRQEFDGSLRPALLLARLAHRWPDVFLRMLVSDEEVLKKYLLVVSERISYGQYINWVMPRSLIFWLRSSMEGKRRGAAS